MGRVSSVLWENWSPCMLKLVPRETMPWQLLLRFPVIWRLSVREPLSLVSLVMPWSRSVSFHIIICSDYSIRYSWENRIYVFIRPVRIMLTWRPIKVASGSAFYSMKGISEISLKKWWWLWPSSTLTRKRVKRSMQVPHFKLLRWLGLPKPTAASSRSLNPMKEGWLMLMWRVMNQRVPLLISLFMNVTKYHLLWTVSQPLFPHIPLG